MTLGGTLRLTLGDIPINPLIPGGRPSPFEIPEGFQPPIGPTIPGTPIGAGICPPGTRCVGPSVQTPIGSACLGICSPIGAGGGTGEDAPIQCPGGFTPSVDPVSGMVTCVPEAGLVPNGGIPPTVPTTPQQQNGCRVCPPSCQLPSGRTGKLNKSRYYRFGDCRRGTSPGVVQPGTVCVKSRRMNPANAKALRRAISRARGFDRLVKANRKALRKLASI